MKNISLILKILFKNFLHVLLKNVLSFINVLFVAPRINSRSLVNPDFVLHAEKNTLLFGLKKRLVLSLMSNTELSFLLFQKNLENFSSMIEIFLQNLHMLLMIFLNIKSKKERVHKIGKYSKKYFTNSDIIHYGLITVIHTFGRDLK